LIFKNFNLADFVNFANLFLNVNPFSILNAEGIFAMTASFCGMTNVVLLTNVIFMQNPAARLEWKSFFAFT